MHNSKLTRESVIQAIARGATTQAEIARELDVSRQAVHQALAKMGIELEKSPRTIALEHYPWETGTRFEDAYENRLMRDHAEYYATGGEGMPDWKLERLQVFYDRLIEEDAVVEFDPALPPRDLRRTGAGRHRTVGGFAWRKRRESDGKLIIRVNRHTRLTPEGELIWRLPPKLPLG